MRLANPEVLFLLLLVPFALWRSLRPRQRGAAQFSGLGTALRVPAGWAVWGPAILATLRASAIVLLVAALARPQTAGASLRISSDGLAIQLVIDNSYSMRLRDYENGVDSMSRLDAVKRAVSQFIRGDEKELSGRPNDKIGIITFARHPEVVCPATLDHDATLDALQRIELSDPVGTNIGDALAWALDRLRHDPAKQKLVILLSDGSHNIPDSLQPLDAAQLAADLKIRVYTIGAVGGGSKPKAKPTTPLAKLRAAQAKQNADAESVDEPTMRRIAEMTGGRYFRATDSEALVRIYQEIDRLETTKFDNAAHITYREWFALPAIPAVVLLVLEQLLAATRFLRVP